MTTSQIQRFNDWVEQVDELIDQYDPGALDPDKTVGEIMRQRAAQRPLLEKIVELASSALAEFPHNPELLRRRGFALCRIVSEQLEFPGAAAGIEDLHSILAFDPNALRGALDLVNELFTTSSMSDPDVAEVANELAERAQVLLLDARVLQTRALVHAERPEEARNVAEHWLSLFPEHGELQEALDEISGPPPSRSLQ